jgi:hypothetical protein
MSTFSEYLQNFIGKLQVALQFGLLWPHLPHGAGIQIPQPVEVNGPNSLGRGLREHR